MTTLDALGSLAPYEAQVVADQLVKGAPEQGWRGDPRLELRIGVLQAGQNGYDPKVKRWVRKGTMVAWRYEVWRHCEDGTDQRLLQRPPNQLFEIIPTLIKSDPRTPGFEPVMDRVEREDRLVQKQKADAIADAHGAMAEHLWNLVADRQNGRTTFRGLPGRNPDKQL